MKRVFRIIMGLACLAVAVCAFAACGKDKCADGHSWEERITPATCTEAGSVEKTCTVCGKTESTAIPPSGHHYDTVHTLRAATCTQTGQEEHICSACGDKTVVETAAIPHQYIETAAKAATCTEDGEIRTMCTMCGNVVTKTVQKLGHLSRTVPALEPTCTQEGYTEEVVCDRCKTVLQPKHTLEKKAHAYTAGVCKDCGAEQTFTATFVALGQTVKQIAFTSSTREKVTKEAPDVPAAQKGYENARWETYEVLLQDFTVRALYDAIRYSITYHDPKNVPLSNPTEYTVEQSVQFAEPQLNGYTFEGWYSGEDRVRELPAGTTGSLTLEAHWALTQYTITYEGIDDPQQYDLPSTYTIESDPIPLPELQETGRTFRGWEMDGRTVAAIPRGSFGDITLRALFDPLAFRVTLDAAGGSVNKLYQDVNYGEYYTLPIPVREGYDFLGWYTNSGDTGMPYTDNAGASLEAYRQFNDKVLYAHWANKIFTVLYDSCGGDPVAPKTYLYGEPFVPVQTSNENGYLFDGWYNESYSVKYTDTTPVTESMTVYARWIDSIPVSTPEGLAAIAEAPTKNYHLTQDINLKGAVWTPIEEFSGILNGNGHSVMNFILSCTSHVDRFAFIKVNKGLIQSLSFKDIVFNVSVSGYDFTTDMVASVLAATNEGIIRDCSLLSGSVNYVHSLASGGRYEQLYMLYFGIITGYNSPHAEVDGCYSLVGSNLKFTLQSDVEYAFPCTKDVTFHYGGIVGENAGTVTNSYFHGAIEATIYAQGTNVGNAHNANANVHIGGLVGTNSSGGVIETSYTDMTIEAHASTNWTCGYVYEYLGGLCGVSDGGTIRACYSEGEILGGSDKQEGCVGGLIGKNIAQAYVTSSYAKAAISGIYAGEFGAFVGRNEAIVKNCYATGSVTCESTSAQNYAGGFVGHATPSSNISMCYSTGNVRAEGGSADHFVGLGENGSTLYKFYYLSQSTVTLNGVRLEKVTEYGSSKELGELWSEEFLVSDLYWDDEGWIILFDEDPILDWETSVSHNYASTIVEPTCEDFGYTVYVCRDCNRIFVRAYTQPLGHRFDYDHPEVVQHTCTADGHVYYRCLNEGENSPLYDSGETDPATGHTQGEFVRGQEATCTEDGFSVYLCTTCAQEYTVIEKATGHTMPAGGDDGNGYEGSCADGQVVKMGRTASVTCQTCGATIRASEEFSPHKFEVDPSRGNEATCTESGLQYLICVHCGAEEEVVLPATGHTVLEGTARCTKCHDYVIDSQSIIKIGNLEQLKSIAQNLNGIYMLTADIDLSQEDWIPIGSEREPFTGWLFGDSRKLKGLTVRGAKQGGLFAVNKGHIVGVTIESAYLYADDLEGASLGAFAAINAGTIVNCTLAGNVLITASVNRVVSDFEEHFDDFENSIGGIAGTNQAAGEISACTVTATMAVSVFQTLKNNAEIDQFYFLRRLWQKDWAVSVAAFYVGGIAGTNLGRIVENCTVSGSVTVNNDQEIDIRHKAPLIGLLSKNDQKNVGNAKITMNLYAGSLVGYNAGTVLKCRAKRVIIANAPGVLSSECLMFSTVRELYTQWSAEGCESLIGCNASSGVCDGSIYL